MMNTDERVPNFYAVSADGYNLSINALPDQQDSAVVIPLTIDAAQGGLITFKAVDIEHLRSGLRPYFTDVQTGIVQDLQLDSAYQVQLDKGVYQNRFYLGLAKDASGLQPLNSKELTAYYSGNSVFVYATAEKGSIVITNALGQVVKTEEVTGVGFHEISIDVSSGIYLVTFNTGNSRKSKKVLIGQ